MEIQVAAHNGGPLLRAKVPPKAWKVPSWARTALITAILVSFPLSNLFFFIFTNRMPTGGPSEGTAGRQWPSEHAPGGRTAGASEYSLHSTRGGQHAGHAMWPEFWEEVEAGELFHRYRGYYNSDSRVIQHYGRVVIVSDQFMGPTEASGTATAMTALAELLSSNGFHVTMLHTRGKATQKGTWELWEQYWSGRGMQLVPLPESDIHYDVAPENAVSHRVYEWLTKAEPFDVVHFSDTDGMAYWTLKAKFQGLGFQRMTTVLHLLAPHLWRKVASLEGLEDVRDLMIDHMQRESVVHADLVVSHSQFALRWCSGNSWEGLHRPLAVFHSSQLMPAWVQRRARAIPDMMPFTEIVFFARLELKKGLVLFCDVLDRIERRSPELLRGIRVTFLGRVPDDQTLPLPGNVQAQTDDYIRSRGIKWRSFTWSIMDDMDTQTRLDYMMAGSRLAVFTMIAENSPYAIQECLVAGIPFIATDIGGVAELMSESDAARLLTEATPKAITARLTEALQQGLSPGRPAGRAAHPEPQTVSRAWVVWHHVAMHHVQALGIDSSMQLPRHPLVTVCIMHFNNPRLLQQAIDSLEGGHYKNIEIVVVDDGSTEPEAQQYLEELNLKFQAKGWKIGQQESRGPGAGRNLAASLANPQTEYFMFMDDDNVAKPHEVLTFLSVAMHTGAQVLTTVSDYFFGNDYPAPDHKPTGRWVPLGAAKEVGIFQNMYGDTNAMVHRDVFWDVGGFPEDFGYAMEDWELFSRCSLAGYKLEAVADPLFWYRLRDTSHSRVTATHSNNMRTIRPYLSTIPQSMHHLVMFAQGMKSSHDASQKELQKEEGNTAEMRNMLKALASSLSTLCQDGKLPTASKNRLPNAGFQQPGALLDGYPAAGWKPFERGYMTDPQGGRQHSTQQAGSLEPAQAVRMANTDWRQSSGATRQVILNQGRPGAVVISGWSKSLKVSGHPDGGYALYVDVVFKDGTKMWGWDIPFDIGTHDWQYKARVLDADVAIEWLQVYAMFRWHSGTVWFDDLAVTLLKEGLCDYSKLALDGIAQHVSNSSTSLN